MELQQLKTFEDACKVLSLDAEKVIPDFSHFPERDQKAMIAHSKLVIIARAANTIMGTDGKAWEPNWDDEDEVKYFPWFGMDGGSSGFRCLVCVRWASGSLVGSRLCFPSWKVAQYIGETFLETYKAYFLYE